MNFKLKNELNQMMHESQLNKQELQQVCARESLLFLRNDRRLCAAFQDEQSMHSYDRKCSASFLQRKKRNGTEDRTFDWPIETAKEEDHRTRTREKRLSEQVPKLHRQTDREKSID